MSIQIARNMRNFFHAPESSHHTQPQLARRKLLSMIAGLPFVALLPACGGPAGQREGSDNRERLEQYRKELKRYAELGYHPKRVYETVTFADFWFGKTDEIAVSLTLPREDGRYPLIVYLPGLGETANNGLLWRKAWAEAGYAVLALQPVSIAQVWSSPKARNGEFADIVREQFSNDALSARVATLRFALDEAEHLATQGIAHYRRIDFSNVVLAGYDLGAQTVQYLTGEHIPGMEAPPTMPNTRSSIVLSPYVAPPHIGVAPDILTARYGAMRLPTLAITGTDDADGYEIVTIPTVRHTPFRYMSPGDKYLLSLERGTHPLLSGMPSPELSDSQGMGGPPSGRGMNGGRGGGPGGHGPGGGMYGPRSGNEPGGERPEVPGSENSREGGPESGMHRSRIDMARELADQEQQAISIQSISTAFLDATILRDAAAQKWLVRDAQQWLQPVASLMSK